MGLLPVTPPQATSLLQLGLKPPSLEPLPIQEESPTLLKGASVL